MPNKKVCKQYPNDQYGPCAPDISGKWDYYLSYIYTPDGTTITGNVKKQIEIKQTKNSLYFNFKNDKGEKIGMLYPVGKCWEAKTVDGDDNGSRTLKITKIKNGKATKMQATYTEAGYQPGNPNQGPSVSVANWYRID